MWHLVSVKHLAKLNIAIPREHAPDVDPAKMRNMDCLCVRHFENFRIDDRMRAIRGKQENYAKSGGALGGPSRGLYIYVGALPG